MYSKCFINTPLVAENKQWTLFHPASQPGSPQVQQRADYPAPDLKRDRNSPAPFFLSLLLHGSGHPSMTPSAPGQAPLLQPG